MNVLKKRNHALAHPIGSERTKADGMVQIKVAPHKWEYKQRYIYEQYYGVELPEDVYVIFLDQDRNNFDIDNLMAVSRHDCARMNALGVFSHNSECTKAGVMVSQLIEKASDKNDTKNK